MKQKLRNLLFSLPCLLLLTGCNKEIVEPEVIDSEYDVKYYAKPPHSSEQQGYLYAKGNDESDFIELSAVSEPPFTLIVSVSDKKGQEALDFIKSKEDSPLISIQDLNPGQEAAPKSYRVVSTKYFQSRHFFVSECFRTQQMAAGTYDISVQPFITIKMHAGQDVKTVEDFYNGVIRLQQENDDGTYLFSCTYKTSYEVLMLTTHIFGQLEVAWAEPSMQGGIIVSNK